MPLTLMRARNGFATRIYFNIASKDDFKRTFDSSFENHGPALSVTPGGNPSSA